MAESFLARGELLADLGRYLEAAEELAQAVPSDVAAQTLRARVLLAADEPWKALAAAEAAVAAGPADLPAMVARGLALAHLGRVDEAAAQAEQILRQGATDAYACSSAALILAAGRTGQVALDAAWEGVRLAPEAARGHLVLGVVAAGLGLAEVARRAYREAQARDRQLLEPGVAVGLAREELYQCAVALASHPSVGELAPPERDPADRWRRMVRTLTERLRRT